MERHLDTNCKNLIATCMGECDDFIRQAPSGRFFITIGHPGFNLPANNRDGFASLQRALAAFRKCAGIEGHTEPEESCEVCAPADPDQAALDADQDAAVAQAEAQEPDDAEDCGHGGRITPHGCAVCLGEDSEAGR